MGMFTLHRTAGDLIENCVTDIRCKRLAGGLNEGMLSGLLHRYI